ncbi:hypothetical protein [Maridesulfovibrio sp.]|uniref:hypothetical protein n=1 Tax=Maridesulfovibrio sp. TaxID=2795000 RepID=UPI002A186A3B|nr:hypothetical protein [Maridesulfovibrio sp.]
MPQGKLKIVRTNVGSTVQTKGIVRAIVAANEGTADRTDEEALKSIFTCLSRNMKEILSLLVQEYGTGASFKTSCTNINRVTGIHSGSVQRILTKFVAEGYLTKQRCREGSFQGFEIRLKPVCNYFHNFILNEAFFVRTTVPTVSPSIVSSINKSTYSEEALKILAVTDEEIERKYPVLAGIGFGTSQLQQIVKERDKSGEPLHMLLMSLEFVNYKLKKGEFKDSKGNLVEKPLGYIFKALLISGEVDKPQGFKTAEEQAADAAEERLRVLKEAKKREMDAQYEIWLLELSAEEREEILKNKIGPEGPFLKTYWKKNVWSKRGGGNDRA